jgi:hypothetical protein
MPHFLCISTYYQQKFPQVARLVNTALSAVIFAMVGGLDGVHTPTGSFFVASNCRSTYCRIPPFA